MASEEETIRQDEIERLLQQSRTAIPGVEPASSPSKEGAVLQGQEESRSAGTTSPLTPDLASPPRSDDIVRSSRGAEGERFLHPTPRTSPIVASQEKASSSAFSGEGRVATGDLEFLFHQAEQALASIDGPPDPAPPGAAPFRLPELAGAAPSTETTTLDLIRDVELDVKIELGRTQMYLEDVLKLRKGSVVPLDKLAGDPVDIYVNGRLIARGEVLVLNDNFCVRVAELIAGVNPAP